MGRRATTIALPLCAALLMCALGGCYDPEEINQFLTEPRPEVSGEEYRVLPPDMIRVVAGIEELNEQTQRIAPDGTVNFPLIGDIYVANMTPKEIQQLLNEKAGKYYERVDTTVQVVGYNSRNFYVFGQVVASGPQPWTGRDTLLDALARSRPNDLAWIERITIIRSPEPQEGGFATTRPGNYRMSGVRPDRPDKERKKMLFNLRAMIEDGDMSNNILLKPNDVVYVQPTPWAKVGLTLRSLLFPVSPVIQTISAPSRLGDAAAGQNISQ
ncbi:MAG: polysaccharide biosynthesis/export family protein [Phycisphaerae bacterium]